MTSSDLAKYSTTHSARGLSAKAELLVNTTMIEGTSQLVKWSTHGQHSQLVRGRRPATPLIYSDRPNVRQLTLLGLIDCSALYL